MVILATVLLACKRPVPAYTLADKPGVPPSLTVLSQSSCLLLPPHMRPIPPCLCLLPPTLACSTTSATAC